MSDGRFSLSPMQEGMVLESIRGARSGVYVEQLVIELREPVTPGHLQRALDQTVARHEALRTRFRFDGTRATQEFPDAVSANVRVHAPDEGSYETFLDEDRRAGFDLDQAPLFRMTLFPLATGGSRLVWTFHHAILDGRSHPLVLEDLFRLLEAAVRGEEADLPDRPSLRPALRALGDRDAEGSDGYWRALLEGCTPGQVPDLGSPSPAEAERGPGHAELSHTLRPDTSARVVALAERCDVTPNTVLQAAWALLLDRTLGTSDVCFGATRAGRHAAGPDAAEIAGVFINTLPMRIAVSAHETVGALLRALREQHVAHRAHERTPLSRIRSLVANEAGSALLGTLVMVEGRSLEDEMRRRDPAWNERQVRLIDQTSFPLTLVARLADPIELELEYDTQRFAVAAIRELIDHLCVVLDALCEGPETELDGIRRLSAQDWAPQVRPPARAEPPPVHDAVLARCDETPEAVAVEAGSQQLSYGDLASRSRFLAAHLRSVGVAPGTRIGLCLERGVDLPVALLAVMDAGATYVPLDPDLPAERLSAIADDAGLEWVLAQRRTEGAVAHLRLPVMSVDGRWSEHVSAAEQVPRRAGPEDVAYILYTSGTTGTPKGVMIAHSALANHATAMQAEFELGPEDRVLQFASFSFDVAVEEIFPTLAAGATLVMRDDEMIGSVSRFLEATAALRISVLNLPTAYWHELVKGVGEARDRWPEGVRLLVVGGEAASSSQLASWQQQGTEHVRFMNAYGPTETTVTTTVFDPERDGWDGGDVPIGRPIAGSSAVVLDPEGRTLPAGALGELFVGGAGLAVGYRGLPELSEERFRVVPGLEDAGRLYATGDRVRRRPDGCLLFAGRDDDQVKVRGYRIELGDVEDAILRHEDVQSAAVVARRAKGGANDHLVAYVVLKPGSPGDLGAVEAGAAGALPSYMRPGYWARLEELPITSSGKVDRKALAARRLQVDATHEEKAPEGPRDALEESLATLWEDLLETSVGVHDNFFEYGGHSLLAVQMMTEIEDELGVACEIPDFFGNPTIAGLASAIRALRASDGHEGVASESATAADAPRSASVIALREDAEGLPLYCVFGLDQYVDLARDLAHRFPVYGVYHPVESMIIDADRGKLEHVALPSLEEAAAGYVEAIRAHRPEGPYCLGGLSFGGTVAFEVARQLRAQGESVPVLALFDTILPRARHADPVGWTRTQWAALRRDPSSEWPRKLARLAALGRRLARKALPGPQASAAGQLDATSGYQRTRERAYHVMSNRYDRPGLAYDGRAILFRAFRRNENPGWRIEYAHGWEQIIHGGLDVRVVEGDHRGILQQPHVSGLAEVLAQYLQAAEGERDEAE